MRKKITSIPPDVEARFPEIVARAVAYGLKCAPADRRTAESALRTIYREAGLNQGVPIVWVSSPLVGGLAASIADATLHGSSIGSVGSALDSATYSTVYNTVHSAVFRAVHSAVDSAVFSAVERAVFSAVDRAVGRAVHSAVRSAVRSAVPLFLHDWRGGQFWIQWPAFVEALEMMGLDDRALVALRAERAVCQSAGWYWPNRSFIMVCERPFGIKRDDAGRLHCENGPSVDYGDTFRMYSWRGTTVPAQWIESKGGLDAKTALTWPNVEQRRAACEIVGWGRILGELNAKSIDRHDNPQVGELVEVLLPGVGNERFLRVQCGTGREFALPVPLTVKTAIEAQAWTWGIDAKEFATPEVRT